MSVFEYNNYKQCVNEWILGNPKRGYGLYSKMADYLGTNAVVISQTFKGVRELTPEQAAKLCQFMGLGSLEADYFLLLVQKERAGSHELKQIYERQLTAIRTQGQSIKNRIKHEQLTDEDKAVFYSSWHKIATWLALTVPKYANLRALANHFRVPEKEIAENLRFLLDKGLLTKKGNGFDFGTSVIHVPHDSPFVNKHHLNWRLKAMQAMDIPRPENLHYTAPMTISRELQTQIREKIVQFIQEQTKAAVASPSEELVCLNIDFFGY